MIRDELESDGVDTSPVVVKSGKTSPFTYVLVDTETLTRTCIHTPSEGEFWPLNRREADGRSLLKVYAFAIQMCWRMRFMRDYWTVSACCTSTLEIPSKPFISLQRVRGSWLGYYVNDITTMWFPWLHSGRP